MSDIITAECPNCFATLKVKGEGTIGKKARCPKCKEPFIIKPRAEEEEAPAAEEEDDDFLNALNSAVKDSSKRRAVKQVKPTKQKSDRRSSSRLPERRTLEDVEVDQDDGMLVSFGVFGWILGGGIGGLIGAITWAAIGYSAKMELGWIAWAIGGLVGFGVHQGVSSSNRSVAPGITAILLVIASVLLGKFLIAWFLFDEIAPGNRVEDMEDPEAAAVSQLEQDVIDEFENQGKKFKDDDNGPAEVALPAGAKTYTYKEARDEAQRRWSVMKRDQQEALIKKAAKAQEDDAGPPKILGVLVFFILLCISPWNILWIFLAGGTAYKVALGIQSGD